MLRIVVVAAWLATIACCGVASGETLQALPSGRATDVTWHDATRNRTIPARIYSPPAGSRPAPVIVVSHEMGGSLASLAYLGYAWAARGYVSIHVHHYGSDRTAEQQSGLRRIAGLREIFLNPNNRLNRILDVRFAIAKVDSLARAAETGQAGTVRIDRERIGVAGHAFGAMTVLAVAGQAVPMSVGDLVLADPRVRAVVAMSPPVWEDRRNLPAQYAPIAVPVLHLSGTNDEMAVSSTRAVERRIPFDHIHRADQFLIIFNGADHMTFCGHRRRLPGRTDGCYQQRIAGVSGLFWDAYLSDSPEARQWLAGAGLDTYLSGMGRAERKLLPASR